MLNNILLAAATATVLLGTLYPLIREAVTGEAISVGPTLLQPDLVAPPPMSLALLIRLAGRGAAGLEARRSARRGAQRLWMAAAEGAGSMAARRTWLLANLASPLKAASGGCARLTIGASLVMESDAGRAPLERVRAFRRPGGETAGAGSPGPPRGVGGWMTLAHLGSCGVLR